jgi:hypothetical protein
MYAPKRRDELDDWNLEDWDARQIYRTLPLHLLAQVS